jgi:hypothetical protein
MNSWLMRSFDGQELEIDLDLEIQDIQQERSRQILLYCCEEGVDLSKWARNLAAQVKTS